MFQILTPVQRHFCLSIANWQIRAVFAARAVVELGARGIRHSACDLAERRPAFSPDGKLTIDALDRLPGILKDLFTWHVCFLAPKSESVRA